MRVAVTGAAGFVGSHLVESLLMRGHGVLALDRPGAALPDEVVGDLTLLEGDVRDESYVSSARLEECEIVFHLAAVVGVSHYLTNPFDVVDVNVLGTRNVLKAVEGGATRVVLASTSEIYGKNPKVPWSEDDDRVLGGTQVDRWSYSTSKAAAEHLTLAAGDRLGIPVTVVRYFNAYGPRQRPNYVISKTVHRALNGEPPLLYDSGKQTRCFTYIDDIVDGTFRAGISPAAVGNVFNIGSNVETSIRAAIDMVLAEAAAEDGVQPFSTAEMFGNTYQDITRRIPDVSKAEALLGWRATTPLDEGIRKTIQWARAHPSWLEPDLSTVSDPTTTSIQP